jgi:hypothetical protein
MIRQVPAITITEVTDPEELARAHARREKFDRNVAWLEAHASEAYSHRGKYICIAGEELFVGDTAKEVRARAKAAHPDDDGLFTRHVSVSRVPRIYAH